jgi:hypothetical protein
MPLELTRVQVLLTPGQFAQAAALAVCGHPSATNHLPLAADLRPEAKAGASKRPFKIRPPLLLPCLVLDKEHLMKLSGHDFEPAHPAFSLSVPQQSQSPHRSEVASLFNGPKVDGGSLARLYSHCFTGLLQRHASVTLSLNYSQWHSLDPLLRRIFF